MHTETRTRSAIFFNCFLSYPLRQGFLLNPGLISSGDARDPPVSAFPTMGSQCVLKHPDFYVSAVDLSSGPHVSHDKKFIQLPSPSVCG